MDRQLEPGVMTITLITQKHGNIKRVWTEDQTEARELRPAEAFSPDRTDQDTQWFWDQVPEGYNEWSVVVPILEGVPVDEDGGVHISIKTGDGVGILLRGLPSGEQLSRIPD